MKVLIFTTQFYLLSGAERLAIELAEEMNKRGVRADILSMYTEDLPGVAQATDDLLGKGIPSVHFLGMKIHPPVTSMFPAILQLRRLISEQEYDAIETSMISPTVLAAWATLGSRTSLVAGVHDIFTTERHNGMRHKVWRYSIQRNGKIRFYAISDYAARCWQDYTNTPPQHTRRIYNGIGNDCFDAVADRQSIRCEFGIPEQGSIVLFVGRMLKRKGIDTILDALEPILEDQNLYVLYVGGADTPECFFADDRGLLERLQTRIKESKMDRRVKFLGRRQDVPRLMASSDILVHPARTEGFGLILAEAMAAGLPVVASNVDGIPEVLKGTNSIMVPPDDPQALREAVLKTLKRPPRQAALAREKGRKRAEDFRMNVRIDSMIGLFDDVIRQRW